MKNCINYFNWTSNFINYKHTLNPVFIKIHLKLRAIKPGIHQIGAMPEAECRWRVVSGV